MARSIALFETDKSLVNRSGSLFRSYLGEGWKKSLTEQYEKPLNRSLVRRALPNKG
jgi:hypothetical protein